MKSAANRQQSIISTNVMKPFIIRIHRLSLTLFLAFTPLAVANMNPAQARFPGTEWETRDPESAGVDLAVLEEIGALMRKVNANGLLVKDGYLVAEWTYGGPPE